MVSMKLRCVAGVLVLVVAGALLRTPALAQAPESLASIEGITTGADGSPLPGVAVMLANKATGDGGDRVIDFRATSDEFGRFAFQGLAPGQYGLNASRDGWVYYHGPSLKVGVRQHSTGVSIKMTPLSVLSGAVNDEDGNPMPGVTVSPMQRDHVVNGRLRIGGGGGVGVKTGKAGEYQLLVEPGLCYLSFEPPERHDDPEQSYITTYYPGVPDLSLAAGLEVVAGQQMPELNLRLRKAPVFHVRGKVVGTVPRYPTKIAAVRGPAEFGFEISEERPQPLRSDGTFDIGGLTSGEWMLVAVGEGSGFMEFGPTGRTNVEVTNRDVEDVVVLVRPGFDIRGSVKMQEAPTNSRPSGEVRLMPVDSSTSSGFWFIGAPIQGDGTFLLEKAISGHYRVDFVPPPGAFVKSVLFDGRECIDSGIEVLGEAQKGLQITVSMGASTITGSVTNPDGALPSTTAVTLMPDGPSAPLYRPELHRVVQTDAIGNFTLTNVVPGTYRLYAWERLDPVAKLPFGEPLAFADPEFPHAFDNMSAVIAVGESESTHVALRLISAVRMEREILRGK